MDKDEKDRNVKDWNEKDRNESDWNEQDRNGNCRNGKDRNGKVRNVEDRICVCVCVCMCVCMCVFVSAVFGMPLLICPALLFLDTLSQIVAVESPLSVTATVQFFRIAEPFFSLTQRFIAVGSHALLLHPSTFTPSVCVCVCVCGCKLCKKRGAPHAEIESAAHHPFLLTIEAGTQSTTHAKQFQAHTAPSHLISLWKDLKTRTYFQQAS